MHSAFDLFALLLVASAGLAYLNHRVLRLPLTIGLLVGAFGFTLLLTGIDAAVPSLGVKPALRGVVADVNFSATLLNGMLAFLLFAGSLNVNSADLLSRKAVVFALATLGTVLSTALCAGVLFAAARSLGLGLSLGWCLVFGALISPTDPVSVLDALKRVGIPPTLQATVAGESLFNDGVGVVLFTLMLSIATGASSLELGATHVLLLFLLEAVGGGLLGLGLGYLAFLLLRRVDDYNVELIISLALAAGTYSLAGMLGVSGPIAVVVAGILIGNHGMNLAMSEKTRLHLSTFWHLVEETLNALLFLLIGLEIAAIELDRASLLAMLIMIPSVLVIRWASVTLSALPLSLRLPHRFAALTILTWGGLRGGLSVAMALSLPEGPAKAPILTIAYGIVLFSIVVQGMTLERVARRVFVRAPALMKPE